jgi:hypothetical protein
MAAAFAAGGLVPLAAWLVLLPALGAWDLYRGGTILPPVAVLLLSCAAGGIVASGGFGGGPRWRAALGAAFCAAHWIPYLVLGAVPALGGGERLVELVIGLAPAIAASHALLGGLGLALGGSGWRRAWRASAAFGAAGAAGGVLLALIVRLAAGGGPASALAVSALGAVLACLLPPACGAWWVGRGRPGSNPFRVREHTRYGR